MKVEKINQIPYCMISDHVQKCQSPYTSKAKYLLDFMYHILSYAVSEEGIR